MDTATVRRRVSQIKVATAVVVASVMMMCGATRPELTRDGKADAMAALRAAGLEETLGNVLLLKGDLKLREREHRAEELRRVGPGDMEEVREKHDFEGAKDEPRYRSRPKTDSRRRIDEAERELKLVREGQMEMLRRYRPLSEDASIRAALKVLNEDRGFKYTIGPLGDDKRIAAIAYLNRRGLMKLEAFPGMDSMGERYCLAEEEAFCHAFKRRTRPVADLRDWADAIHVRLTALSVDKEVIDAVQVISEVGPRRAYIGHSDGFKRVLRTVAK
jgi:hypothetical protein